MEPSARAGPRFGSTCVLLPSATAEQAPVTVIDRTPNVYKPFLRSSLVRRFSSRSATSVCMCFGPGEPAHHHVVPLQTTQGQRHGPSLDAPPRSASCTCLLPSPDGRPDASADPGPMPGRARPARRVGLRADVCDGPSGGLLRLGQPSLEGALPQPLRASFLIDSKSRTRLTTAHAG